MSIAHTDRLATAMRTALDNLPGSLNSLAKRAGVSQTLLWQIADGSRNVTPAVAAKVAAALERWGDESRTAGARCRAAAKAIRRAASPHRRK